MFKSHWSYLQHSALADQKKILKGCLMWTLATSFNLMLISKFIMFASWTTKLTNGGSEKVLFKFHVWTLWSLHVCCSQQDIDRHTIALCNTSDSRFQSRFHSSFNRVPTYKSFSTYKHLPIRYFPPKLIINKEHFTT